MITVDFNRLDIKPGYRILDLGCGTGRHTCAAYRLKQVTVVGVDISFDDVFEARDRLRQQHHMGEHRGGVWGISVTDILHLPFSDNCFDLVICSEVLEHIFDENTALAEIIRVLKPEKDLVVSVPRYFPERICWALSEKYYNRNGGHIRIYKKQGLIDLLESTGLEKRKISFAHSLHTPYWWLKCLVNPGQENGRLVNLYHRLLVWDMMKRPWLTRLLEHLLNPVLGKSLVIYLKKV